MNIKWMTYLTGISLFLAAAPVFAWRCNQGFVDVGDSAQTVTRKCGRPDFIYGSAGKAAGKRSVVLWYYDSGPLQLVRVLRLRAGVLESIDTAGYGLRETTRVCTPADIRSGMQVYELAKRCGKPRRKRVLGKRSAGNIGSRAEVWTYDLGVQYLLQQVTIVDGQVQTVETVSRSQRRSKSRS